MTAMITTRDLYTLTLAERDILIIDVRTPEEYAEVHIAGAKSLPLSEFISLDVVDKVSAMRQHPNQVIYITCAIDRRSQQACNFLIDADVESVTVVEGGTEAWLHEGFPVDMPSD